MHSPTMLRRALASRGPALRKSSNGLWSVAVLGLLLFACGEASVSGLSSSQEPTPAALRAEEAARASFLYAGVQNRVDRLLGCAQHVLAAVNKAEEDYRSSRQEGSSPVETVPQESSVWVCDFAGQFGLPGKPTAYARVVLKDVEGASASPPGYPFEWAPFQIYYTEPPPTIAAA